MASRPDAWGDFTDQADQLAGYFHDTCKPACAMPLTANAPPIWLLSAGSNAASGKLAAEKEMGLAVALYVNDSVIWAHTDRRVSVQP